MSKNAVIKTKDVRNAHIDEDYIIVVGAEDGRSGLKASVKDAISAKDHPGVDEAYDRAFEEYDPSEYEGETVLARIEPDGTTEWPLE